MPELPVGSDVRSSSGNVMDVLQTFQASLDKHLTTVTGHLESIGTN